MQSFFTPSFEPLQAHVVDLLAEDGVHSVLPLLGVNHLLRGLAVSKLLRSYKQGSTASQKEAQKDVISFPDREKGEGEYIALMPCSICFMDCAYEENDPRAIFAALHEAGRDFCCPLYFTSFDPKTMLCSFKPEAEEALGSFLLCDDEHEQSPEFPFVFELYPTGWLRPATSSSTHALRGLEFAARPDRHPPLGEHLFFPQVPPKPQKLKVDSVEESTAEAEADVEEKEKMMPCGWKISYYVLREDWWASDRAGIVTDVPTLLIVDELKIPLIDLFAPRGASTEPGYL
ncbi:hypothetical protein JCM10213_002471 [Rhodosporidiobolus nylandii]